MYLLWLALSFQLWMRWSRSLEVARNTRASVRPHRKNSLKKLLVGIVTIAHVPSATCHLCVVHEPSSPLGHLGGGPQLSHGISGRSEWVAQTLKLGLNESGPWVSRPGPSHVSWDPRNIVAYHPAIPWTLSLPFWDAHAILLNLKV